MPIIHIVYISCDVCDTEYDTSLLCLDMCWSRKEKLLQLLQETSMSDWDTEPSKEINNASPALVAAVAEYKRVASTLEKLQEQHASLIETIAAEFPMMSGEQAIDVGGMTVTCNRTERWTWDADYLEDLFMTSDTLPDHVKKKLTVNKRLFQNLDDSSKAQIIPALTRTPGPPKIRVIEVDNV